MVRGEQAIESGIGLLLRTRIGERVMRPEYGCGVWEYLFAVPDYTTLRLMEDAVRTAIIRWEPRVRDVRANASLSWDGDGNGRVDIQVSYVVRATNNPHNRVFPFYLDEGFKAVEG